jgi:bifunctional UDP-N-acetylglucosamine pyrophosphorylase/glucosamine-1-phosphate N-acetyltransferase
MNKKTAALILAAGKGKRMHSGLPKVLHTVAELPMVAHVVKLALARACSPIVVVVDPGGARIREVLTAMFPDAPLVFAVQKKRLGTADATRAALESIPDFNGRTLVLYGDVPLLKPGTVGRLDRALQGVSLSLLTATAENPAGYGRVLREGRWVKAIVEHRDASSAQRQIDEINVGVYLCDHALLRRAVSSVGRDNRQGEAYLTDVVAIAAGEKGAVGVRVADPEEVHGVNTRADLAQAEAAMQRRLQAFHQSRGVTIRDPAGTFLSTETRIQRDTVLGVGVQLSGKVTIGAGARIDGPTVIRNAAIGAGSQVHSFCHIEGAKVGQDVSVGPFARLRPEAKLEPGSRVGNFVEIKKARLGRGAKANHLTYLGDSEIGAGTNIGAGTITCNYDGGPVKHATLIGPGAFIGSNTTLVAPVRVGSKAYVGAGSTINMDVPADALAIGRGRQANKRGYAKRLRRRIQKKKDS